MFIRAVFIFLKYFAWIGYPLYVFNLYSKLNSGDLLWQYWLSALVSVAGIFLIIREVESKVFKGGD